MNDTVRPPISWNGERTDQLDRRHRRAEQFRLWCAMMTGAGCLLLVVLLLNIWLGGWRWLDWHFLTSYPSRFAAQAGLKSALAGSVWVMGLTALFSIPIGVCAAIYLEEYARPNLINTIIEVTIANLAGVPSIVFGMLGLVIFVRGFALGRSVLAGALTMTLLVLPIVIIASREALRSVPVTIRQGAFALGASRWQTVYHHVLAMASPGIMTGIILALSRAMGETAPLIMIGALTYVAFVPAGPMDAFTALPIQIFNWVSRPQQEFHGLAAAAIIVLLGVLILLNGLAIYLRQRSQRRIG